MCACGALQTGAFFLLPCNEHTAPSRRQHLDCQGCGWAEPPAGGSAAGPTAGNGRFPFSVTSPACSSHLLCGESRPHTYRSTTRRRSAATAAPHPGCRRGNAAAEGTSPETGRFHHSARAFPRINALAGERAPAVGTTPAPNAAAVSRPQRLVPRPSPPRRRRHRPRPAGPARRRRLPQPARRTAPAKPAPGGGAGAACRRGAGR